MAKTVYQLAFLHKLKRNHLISDAHEWTNNGHKLVAPL